MVEDGAFSHKIDFAIFLCKLNLKGHLNDITVSRVLTILLNGQMLPFVGASAVEGLGSTGIPRIVLLQSDEDGTFISDSTKYELNRRSL